MGHQSEGESLADLGREIAGDAAALVRAEIDLVKARIRAAAISLAAGVGLLLVALAALAFHIVFAVGTVDEGRTLSDNWLFFAAAGALVVAALLLAVAGALGPVAGIGRGLGALCGAAAVGLTIAFYVAILVSASPRAGWAISALVAFAIAVACGGTGALLLLRAKRRGFGTVDTLKEDAAWLTGLRKRNGLGR